MTAYLIPIAALCHFSKRDFSMDVGFLLTFLVIFHLVPLFSAQDFDRSLELGTCPKDFQCGKLGIMKFPFTNHSQPTFCGLCTVDCHADPFPKIKLDLWSERWFYLKTMSQSNFRVQEPILQILLRDHSCYSLLRNISPPPSPSISFEIMSTTITLFICQKVIDQFLGYRRHDQSCSGFNVYYKNPKSQSSHRDWEPPPTGCTPVRLPIHSWDNITDNTGLFQLLTADFDLQWHLSDECYYDCHLKGGFCQTVEGNKFHCAYADTKKNLDQSGNKKWKIILGTALGGAAILMIAFAIFLVLCRKKGIKYPFYLLSRNSSEPSSNPDIEGGSVYFGVPVFSYAELEEVTNNFDISEELGNGGFGTVYYGKLRDGREVAVKRLYEHNFKRMAQFMNEVEILTRLRHRNLVSLYGCTSKRSRELLLVYEYIPNGTVAHHLHGDRAKDQSLTWPVRMNIATETADALAYLHASDIIHRDVKTNNILLDYNFQVKVVDFGLSRLFPNDVSHISTAPQGTPGYVDPEYYQCYQLTDKSDVYSFGVVLIELISSMPAVDISRHRHEINLANFAINRIQRHAFNELIDPSLGYESDPEVMRMTTSVAELAFRCLQLEKEMRPTMDEVFETLKAIQDCNENSVEKTNEINKDTAKSRGRMCPASPESDDIVLFEKNTNCPSSPNSVTDLWVSSSTTTTSN